MAASASASASASAASASAASDRGRGTDPRGTDPSPAWRPAVLDAVGCGRSHHGSVGRFDEAARRLTHEELFVAKLLASEGHDVQSLRERPGRGRTADLLVCGKPLEIKSWLEWEERGRSVPRPASVTNKLLNAEGQALAVVLNARGSGMTATIAQAGMAEYANRRASTGVRVVRVLGDGFDVGWSLDPSLWRRTDLVRSPTARCARIRPIGPNHHDLGVGP